MVEHGSIFHNYNSELINCVENLKCKREQLVRSINLEEIEQGQIIGEINKLNERLAVIAASLKLKNEAKMEFDKAIAESEIGYSKLIQTTEDTFRNLQRNICKLGYSEQKPCTPQYNQPRMHCCRLTCHNCGHHKSR